MRETGVVEDRQALLDAVSDIAETLRGQEAADEAGGTLSSKTVEAMQQAGMFALKTPAALGGAEADPVTQIMVLEALAHANAAAGWCTMVGATGAGLPGAFLADSAVGEMFKEGIPRCAVVAMPIGKTEVVDGGYRLTGRWPFASGIRHSQWLAAGAIVQRGDRAERRMLVFPTASANIHDNWQVAGLAGTGSCDFSVEDLFVPEEYSWALLTDTPKRGGPLYRLGHPGFVANEHAGFALGVARRALEAFLEKETAKARGYTDNRARLSARPAIQRLFGEGEMHLRAARALALEVNDTAWETVQRDGAVTIRQQGEMRAVATHCTDVALDIVTTAFRHAGGGAIYRKNILQQCLRDMNAAAQHLMVSDIAYENLGQMILGVPDVNPMR